MKKILLVCFCLFLAGLAACAQQPAPPVSTPEPTLTPRTLPTATAQAVRLPAALPVGAPATYNDLQVVMAQAEITSAYKTEYGSMRQPAANARFLWAQIALTNNGQSEMRLPAPEHFSVIFMNMEFKPSYGHRAGYDDYSALKSNLIPGETLRAWLRFEIPAELELPDLQVAFLPESTQISLNFLDSAYPWADRPLYLWECAP